MALQENTANQRRDFLHKLSCQITNDYDAVCVESLNMKAMSQCLNLGKSKMPPLSRHEARDFNPKVDYDTHTIISNPKAFISGTYHGLGGKHLQSYLDELCYHLNRRLFLGEILNRVPLLLPPMKIELY